MCAEAGANADKDARERFQNDFDKIGSIMKNMCFCRHSREEREPFSKKNKSLHSTPERRGSYPNYPGYWAL